jgi:hypothetical protein
MAYFPASEIFPRITVTDAFGSVYTVEASAVIVVPTGG